MPKSFEEQVAQAVMDIFNEWMRLSDQRPTWMMFISPRVAAAIKVAAMEADNEAIESWEQSSKAALAALRGATDLARDEEAPREAEPEPE